MAEAPGGKKVKTVPIPPHGVIRMEVLDIVCICNIADNVGQICLANGKPLGLITAYI